MNFFVIDNLSFRFSRNQDYFFNNLNLSLNYSESNSRLIFVSGKNGVGKSTLFKILQGDFDKESDISGHISISQTKYDLSDPATVKYLKAKVSTVNQNVSVMLADKFTGHENLAFARFGMYPGFATFNPNVGLDLCSKFQIPLDTRVMNLSGGQKQILALLMAVQKNASLLLLDEPTSALDELNSYMVMDFLKELACTKSMLILIICHDQSLIQKYSELRIVNIFKKDGRVVAQ